MNYWIVIDRQKYGPLTLEEARRLPMTAESFVWRSGLPSWVKARELPELADLFIQAPAGEEPVSVGNADISTLPDEPDSNESNATVAGPEEAEPETPAEPEAAPAPRRPEPYRPKPYRPEAYTGGAPLPPPPAPSAPSKPMPPKPNTYLVWSILSVILCCMIPGIVAIIYSAKVTSRYEQGDYEGSMQASESAELWLIITIVCGLVSLPFQFLYMLMR